MYEGSISIEGEAPWVNVSGDIAADVSFEIAGVGVVAGFPDIAVTLEGTWSDGVLTADYTMGSDGGLPGGFAIVYEIFTIED